MIDDDIFAQKCFALRDGEKLDAPDRGYIVFRWRGSCWWILWFTPMSHAMPLGKEFKDDITFLAFIHGNMQAGKNMTRETHGYMGPLPQ